ncbi:uncharacterized protein MONOS_14243 [Monocercomonoides exilis]|uniref:uncharacterized protein n=1 Tax=Monocercomonoides exilis TaxID=2049356 RepID=UPI00355AACBC|nr:hypothetical protein MONOS_14243 [Monocercomonoides exilis]|eukprot:MONOS_14243.1-p1 / transcript=MONOS_14243.1 / gene=MONOS_14243 / organism=Monocercomonoides_exilis_PA203 / gene_product=unspecified product / transcript_product=unspecified product / location=Mono_scaffold00961:19352-20838(+) / protein_length=472 / sequence_SO=supercontig / SO=protein_coding / is_pseudo=false
MDEYLEKEDCGEASSQKAVEGENDSITLDNHDIVIRAVDREEKLLELLNAMESKKLRPTDLFKNGFVSKSSFYRAAKARKEGRDICRIGRPPILNKRNKTTFLSKIKDKIQLGAFPCARQVKDIAIEVIAEDQHKPTQSIHVCRTWPYSFIKSNEDLFFVHPIHLPAARAAHSTKECLFPWFEKVRHLYNEHQYKSELIFNLDEVFITTPEVKPSLVVASNKNDVYMTPEPSLPAGISGLFLVSADGVSYPAIFKIRAKKLPKEYSDATEHSLRFTVDDTPSMTAESFRFFFEKAIVPFMIQRRKFVKCEEEHCLLFMDSLAAHLSRNIIQCAKDNRVDLCFPPSHTSHLVQPLDLYVNANFKNSLRITDYETHEPNASSARRNFVLKLRTALYAAFSPSTITASFRDAGIWPFNPDIVLSKLPEKKPEWAKVSSKIMDPQLPYFNGRIFLSTDPMAPYDDGVHPYFFNFHV